jgi:ribonucleotide reductase alpha subunit
MNFFQPETTLKNSPQEPSKMYVQKRNGESEPVYFDKITARNNKLAKEFNLDIDTTSLSMEVIKGLKSGMTTREIDQLSCECASIKSVYEPDYEKLAIAICIDDLHKTTPKKFSLSYEFLKSMYRDSVKEFIENNRDELDNMILQEKDYSYSYFGFKTLQVGKYLLKKDNVIGETPQYLLMRAALGAFHNLNKPRDVILQKIKTTYNYLSDFKFTVATPSLFHSALNFGQLSSCFLLSAGDSIVDLTESWRDCSLISKNSGGLGVDMTFVRGNNSFIEGIKGNSSGIIPFIKVYNEVGRAVNQGGKRKGAIAMYLQPWHPDILDFLKIRSNTTKDERAARDIFTALWCPDILFKRVEVFANTEVDMKWSLFCPKTYPQLVSLYGEEFEKEYLRLETEKKYVAQISLEELWTSIFKSLEETGMPYMMSKDNVNRQSNQMNIGSIYGSNLCVAGDTKILTREYGYRDIQHVDCAHIWNGNEWSDVSVKKTGEDRSLTRVYFSNGLYLDCTPEHNFYIEGENGIQKVACSELKHRDLLISHDLPKIDFSNIVTDGYDSRFTSEDVPIYENNIHHQVLWLKNYFEKCGKEIRYGYWNVFVKNREFGADIIMLLQILGVNSKMLFIGTGYTLFTNIIFYSNTNVPATFYVPTDTITEDYSVYVSDISPDFRVSDTYCFTEKKRGMGMFNGVLTGQCAEIVEYHDKDSIASCNLASIGLPTFFLRNVGSYDFEDLGKTAQIATETLDRIITNNSSPTEKCISNNRDLRPIGLGVQGLADVFVLMKLPWDSVEALQLNAVISEVIYYNALKKSVELAIEYGPYVGFSGSPASKRMLQFDLAGKVPFTSRDNVWNVKLDWEGLKDDIVTHGLRNSLVCAYMPTASTSQIMGFNEAFEPFTSNIYARKTNTGDFVMVNKYLVSELMSRKLWSKTMVDKIINANGSIQDIVDIPDDVKSVYKTVWEIKQKYIVDMAAARTVDQSQSMNIYIARPTLKAITSLYIDAWKKGLKTLSYYMRSKPATNAVKYTTEQGQLVKTGEKTEEKSEKEPLVVNGKTWICEDGSCCSA